MYCNTIVQVSGRDGAVEKMRETKCIHFTLFMIQIHSDVYSIVPFLLLRLHTAVSRARNQSTSTTVPVPVPQLSLQVDPRTLLDGRTARGTAIHSLGALRTTDHVRARRKVNVASVLHAHDTQQQALRNRTALSVACDIAERTQHATLQRL
jgi:hypothetical protein